MAALGLWTIGCGGQPDEAPEASSTSPAALGAGSSERRMNACALNSQVDS
jgi:hypothetical protein